MTATSTDAAPGFIAHVDPNEIQVDTNVRTVVTLDPEFVESIRQHGVLEPVVCCRDEDGTLKVRMGQRRTLAARDAGRPTIPAYIVDGDNTTVDRIVQQLAENDQRSALSQGERALAYRQLTLEGISVAQVAKRTGASKADIQAAIKVTEGHSTVEALHEFPIAFDHAAAILEFEEYPELHSSLIETASTNPDRFAHHLERAKQDRDQAILVAAEAERFAALGITVLEEVPEDRWYSIHRVIDKNGRSINPDEFEALEIPADHKAVTIRSTWWNDRLNVARFIREPESHGYTPSAEDGSSDAPLTDEQKAERKAERKALIENNKAMDAATVVRREFLATLLSRKTLPKDAGTFIARALTAYRGRTGGGITEGNALAIELLGLEGKTSHYGPTPLDKYMDEGGSPARATLAIAMGGIERVMHRQSWRMPTEEDATWLTQLEEWGYTLSDVERIITDTIAERNGSAAVA
ncbi:MAG: ParB/RepB/Spo0J family partition protein [Microbacteriaceae bacterium]|nr:ParB/RepB/Spo0J family partition protein [Microbacteriaceae bacterium]